MYRYAFRYVALLILTSGNSFERPGSSVPPSQYPRGEILIGVANPQNAAATSTGRELTAGSASYFDFVNANGGVTGHRIKMIVKDDNQGLEPPLGVTNELITRDHVLFLFDYVGTPTLRSVLPLLQFHASEQIITFAPMTGAALSRTSPNNRFVFNVRASYEEEAKALVEFLFRRGCRRFGFLGQQDAFGKSGEVGVEKALGRHGLSLVQSVWYKDTADSGVSSTMRGQVSILRRDNVDAVIVYGIVVPVEHFIRDCRGAKWSVPIANVSLVEPELLLAKLHNGSPPAGIDFASNLVNSRVVPSTDQAHYPLVREFCKHVPFPERGSVRLEGWLNAKIATKALRRCSINPSRSDFLTALSGLRSWDPGLGHTIDFSTTEHQALHTVWIITSKQGKWIPAGALVNNQYEDAAH